jgi:hypothetical protein
MAADTNEFWSTATGLGEDVSCALSAPYELSKNVKADSSYWGHFSEVVCNKLDKWGNITHWDKEQSLLSTY